MTSDTHDLAFHESLEDDDFGLIICGKTGILKGLWIPQHLEDEEVPETIVKMCVEIFGIDPEEFEEETSYGKTLH